MFWEKKSELGSSLKKEKLAPVIKIPELRQLRICSAAYQLDGICWQVA